jgi:type II restriction/modification system DNA methylase subunit YeeA
MKTNPQIHLEPLQGVYRRLSVMRIAMDSFKTQLSLLLEGINEKETEEFHKNLVIQFLQETYYKSKHFINTKGRNDLVIHNGETAKSPVGVIIEAKKPTNTAEMPTLQDLNVKAFHELILYYLRERITHKNLEIKHLIITNVYEWFVFDVQEIDRLFAQNKTLVQQFQDFEAGRLADSRTEFFYKHIAEPFVANLQEELTFVYCNLKNYRELARQNNPDEDKKLLDLYRLFTPEFLLKLPFVNDSNTLDRGFYFELLHIMGLTEVQEGGKKLIQRKAKGERNTGSILEETIVRIESLQKLDRLPTIQNFGATREEQLFGVALELTITWINRILFLKLLEAQLLSYHKGNKAYAFLAAENLRCASGLDVLFFEVLAKQPENRHPDTQKLYEKIPYLNSSLFEITELEHQTVLIGNLHTDKILPLYPQTVLKDYKGHKQTEGLRTLDYLFAFLDAYDFGAEGKGEIQEDNKPLITASVLGLVFEKINGYQDGSFFTPGFITMYMCRETIRRAVVQKFNEVKQWNCETIEEVAEKIKDRQEAEKIVNSLKICDPAVGSGHFLVSALNEMLVVKHELGILMDKNGRTLSRYAITVENDELKIVNEDKEVFMYFPHLPESRRVQETIFRQKQIIIENCLFGVDINPNSVKICRLRLWIELLKNAYYTEESNYKYLETLPNIDINIKTGNSLISKLQLNDSLNQFSPAQRQTIRRLMPDYKKQVSAYKGVTDKDAKRRIVALLDAYRQTFLKMFNPNDADYQAYKTLENKWVTEQLSLHQTEEVLEKLQAEMEAAKAKWDAKAEVYRRSFEWRFEFPEVLDDEGNFVGFDVVLGNPPYIPISNKSYLAQIQTQYLTYAPTGDIYALFVELGQNLIKDLGYSAMIISNKWLRASYGQTLRHYLINKTNPILLVDFGQNLLFEKAVVHTSIIFLRKELNKKQLQAVRLPDGFFNDPKAKIASYVAQNLISNLEVTDSIWNLIEPNLYELKAKIESKFVKLANWEITINFGVKTGLNKAFIVDESTKNTLISKDSKNKEILKPILRGRDTRRYYCNYANLWLINSHNGYDNVPPIDIVNDYPVIFNYLKPFEKAANSRFDKGKHWTNLRNCAYINKFEEPKIIFSEIVSEPQFYYDEKGYYPEATVFFISGEKLKYLTALLNSKAVTFFFKTFYMGGELVGKIRYKKVFLEQVPLPIPTKEQEQQIEKLVNKILVIKENDSTADVSNLETEIDHLVYQLYDLTAEEIKIVEDGTK